MDAQSLASDLRSAPEESLVRLLADWIARAAKAPQLDLHVEPPLDGRRHVDALVAAAAAEVARQRGERPPAWANQADRRTQTFWYPGPAALFPNALVHAPLAFRSRGVFIDAASLRSL